MRCVSPKDADDHFSGPERWCYRRGDCSDPKSPPLTPPAAIACGASARADLPTLRARVSLFFVIVTRRGGPLLCPLPVRCSIFVQSMATAIGDADVPVAWRENLGHVEPPASCSNSCVRSSAPTGLVALAERLGVTTRRCAGRDRCDRSLPVAPAGVASGTPHRPSLPPLCSRRRGAASHRPRLSRRRRSGDRGVAPALASSTRLLPPLQVPVAAFRTATLRSPRAVSTALLMSAPARRPAERCGHLAAGGTGDERRSPFRLVTGAGGSVSPSMRSRRLATSADRTPASS